MLEKLQSIMKHNFLQLFKNWKSTEAKCGLAMIEALPQRFWSYASKEMCMNPSSNENLPLLIVDPIAISNLAVALNNGAFEGTISRGSAKPSCITVVTANMKIKNE